MLTLAQALAGYFKNHLGIIRNSYGILFAHYRGINAECPLPAYKGGALLHLVMASPGITDFINDCSLQSINDLYKITSEWMYDRYLKGKAEICCMLTDYDARTLYFRLKGNVMYARDVAGCSHRVPVVLVSPAEMIRYTKMNA